MKTTKSNLDEMQELELLKVEHNGCWLAFWGLMAAMIIQTIAYGKMDFRTLAGEWIVFMALSVYLAIGRVHRGIWDRRMPMNTKTNLIMSAIAAMCVGALNAVIIFKNFHKPVGTMAAALITMAITFVICSIVLTVMMKQTQKRRKELEEEPEE